MRRINFDEIYVFLKVVQAGRFSSAAHQLNMPKSTVSTRVSSLEKRLGISLLQRTTRKLKLTEVGRIYYERCLDALVDITKAEADIKAYQLQPQGTLRIAVPSFLGEILLPKVILECAKKYPKINLEVLRSDGPVDFPLHEIDIALAVGPFVDSSLISKKLGILPIAAFANPNYLKANNKPQHPKDLENHTLIQYRYFGSDAWTFIRDGAKFRLKSPPQITMDEIHLVQAVAIMGGGIALLPNNIGLLDKTEDGLVRVLPEWRLQELQIHFIYPRHIFPMPNFRAFLEIAESSFKKQLGQTIGNSREACQTTILPNLPKLEGLPFSPSYDVAKIGKLQARVFELEPGIFYFKELSIHSKFQLDVMFERLNHLTSGHDNWCLVIDLSEATQPKNDLGDYIREKLLELSNPKFFAIIYGKNQHIQIAARLIIGDAITVPFCLVETVPQAVEKAREALPAAPKTSQLSASAQ